MATNEVDGQPEIAMPGPIRMAGLLFFAPSRLWGRMVAWGLDGDPGLLHLGGPRRWAAVHVVWVRSLLDVAVASALVTFGLVIARYGWQPELVPVLLYGVGFSLAIIAFVGVAFGTAIAGLQTAVVLGVLCLPEQMGGISSAILVVALCAGFGVRVGWTVAERLRDANEARNTGSRSLVDRMSLAVLTLSVVSLVVGAGGGGTLVWAVVAVAFLTGVFGASGVLATRRRLRPLAFINYWRSDTASSKLALELHLAFPRSTFFDQGDIPSGSHWVVQLDSFLDRATVLLALCGPEATFGDSPGKRDTPGFWVALEQGYARRCGIPIVPVRVTPESPISNNLRSYQGLTAGRGDIMRTLAHDHGLELESAPGDE